MGEKAAGAASPTRFGDSRRPSVVGARGSYGAVDKFVASGSVVNLGCGRPWMRVRLLLRLASGALRDVTAMATSDATERRLREFGIAHYHRTPTAVGVALTGCTAFRQRTS